jgi:hypothetical protein
LRRRGASQALRRRRSRPARCSGFGAKGPGTSVYFRDPDGSLMEFMSYIPQRMVQGERSAGQHDPTVPAARYSDPAGRRCARGICRAKLPDLALPATVAAR